MEHLYRISQPTGLMGFSQRPRQGTGDDNPYSERRASVASDGADGRDFASVLARMMAR